MVSFLLSVAKCFNQYNLKKSVLKIITRGDLNFDSSDAWDPVTVHGDFSEASWGSALAAKGRSERDNTNLFILSAGNGQWATRVPL